MAGAHVLQKTYGAGVRHLLVTVAAFALAAYAVARLGLGELWDTEVWWKSILVWFLGAVLFHDLLLFPVYALADRFLVTVTARRGAAGHGAGVPVLNHVRVPVLAVGLLLLLFLPGIIEQGATSYLSATGQTQEPFLERWLVLSGAICTLSALTYAVRVARRRRGRRGAEGAPPGAT